MSRPMFGRGKKLNQPAIPSLSFRAGILSVPGYAFEKATAWEDTGSMTGLAEGTNLRDGSAVLAKIAPARTQGSMILEREAHLLESTKQSGEAASVVLSFIDFLTIPRANGDCVILLVEHPGLNQLARFFPSAKVNPFLLADYHTSRPGSSYGLELLGPFPDEYVAHNSFEYESSDIMDLSSFLEFSIQATHCLQMLHQMGIVHREVRANAFHLAASSGRVRLVHFGNRAISLEQFGGPSELLIQADSLEETGQLKVKEALCYLAPEQTTQSPDGINVEDHRTDLYALGIFFWSLLVGRAALPFEGSPMQILHHISLKRPNPVHEVRRDVPQVLALIIDKLIAKSADHRYQSCYGLKSDLLECQRLLLASVHTRLDHEISELIPTFEIAKNDRYMHFSIPATLFGREKELETIRDVIKHLHTSGSGFLTASTNMHDGDRTPMSVDDKTDYINSSTRSDKSRTPPTPVFDDSASSRYSTSVSSPGSEVGSFHPSNTPQSDGLRRAALVSIAARPNKVHSVLVFGPPGAGKSTLILSQQAKWRAYGIWGQAKCQRTEAAPFAALMGCLSSMLRQLMVFSSDLYRFVTMLQSQLGPQMQNIPLLYQGAPELKHILSLYDVEMDSPHESLSTDQLRARFQSVVASVFSVLAQTRISALFLDDLHEADASLLELLHTLANSKSRMVIFCTLRKEEASMKQAQTTFTSKSRTTWVELDDGLNLSAISHMISKTLHCSREECAPLSRLVHNVSHGNAFSARSFLMTLYRQGMITYNWDRNFYQFDLETIQASLVEHKGATDPNDPQFLLSHLRALHVDAQRFLVWASLFGATFKVAEVGFMVHWEDATTGTVGDDDMGEFDVSKAFQEHAQSNTGRESMRGLQIAIQEGWLIQRGRELCSFSHDRYHQAARDLGAADWPIAKMSYRIILMILSDPSTPDAHRIADQASRCLPLLRLSAERSRISALLVNAAESSWSRGAHETALQAFNNIRAILGDDHWSQHPEVSLKVFLRLAELNLWSVNYMSSIALVEECLVHAHSGEDKARLLWIRSRVHWVRNDFVLALEDVLQALGFLDTPINPNPTSSDLDTALDEAKDRIMAIGVDGILNLPRCKSERSDLIAGLLVEGANHAYWGRKPEVVESLGWETVRLGLHSGISPGTGIGFQYAVAFLGDRRNLHRFCISIARVGERLSLRFGGNQEKCKTSVLFCALFGGYDTAHYAANGPRLADAAKYGYACGDRPFTVFTLVHCVMVRLFTCDYLSDLVPAAEEALTEIRSWAPESEPLICAQGILNCARALGGRTMRLDAETIYETTSFSERIFLEQHPPSRSIIGFNMYNAFKVCSLYSLGFIAEASELGFSVYSTRETNPGHRHNRFGLFFHTLALVSWLRLDIGEKEQRTRYKEQIARNRQYIATWVHASPINAASWMWLIDAEVASLSGTSPDALRLYDTAVTTASQHEWPMEESWALWLEGCHYIRMGITGLGTELQRRGIARHAQWGARGIVEHLTSQVVGGAADASAKRLGFTAEAAVQTVAVGGDNPLDLQSSDWTDKSQQRQLSADDLASILRWSSDISRDINLSNALRRLTEIVMERSGAQYTCVVIAQEGGDFGVATTMNVQGPCQLHDMQKPIRTLSDPLQVAVIGHVLNIKSTYTSTNIGDDTRFASEAASSPHSSVVCLPIHGNRGQTHGVVYLASEYRNAFISGNIITILTLLCEQVSVSIANALLFRSVQVGTRENLKMIASQKESLDQARKHREEAEKATSAKSNFLASMSHELRTPFSAFYGLLDLLDGDSELTASQREIVQTAKQSCELLLKIIDSILDYSKLEASAVKLDFSGYSVENIVADCVELLLPSAAKKLDLCYDIAPNVPAWIKSDYSRIRQVLMNLCANAVKFTTHGKALEEGPPRRNTVAVSCTLDDRSPSKSNHVLLRFSVRDTGIGMTQAGCESLFKPFQQLENGTTRRFGGTGLGLSISRQLVTLMGGDIGVNSVIGEGSTFWFTIPVELYKAEEVDRATDEIRLLKSQLTSPHPIRLLVISASPTTRSLLSTLLSGFSVTIVSSMTFGQDYLQRAHLLDPPLDFVILDDQSDKNAEDLTHQLQNSEHAALKNVVLVHLYTPTTDSLTSGQAFKRVTRGIVRTTKPPRQARLLQTLAKAKNISVTPASQGSAVQGAVNNVAAAKRTLYGNVLIAEDNPVAQQLLVKQLQKHQLNVVATSDGQEAIDQWEAHKPGFFTIALFDHHMPVCDGVEAARRIRQAEERRGLHISLPIIALSADAQESTKKMCLSNGFTAFFSKPLKKGDMANLLSSFGPESSTPP